MPQLSFPNLLLKEQSNGPFALRAAAAVMPGEGVVERPFLVIEKGRILRFGTAASIGKAFTGRALDLEDAGFPGAVIAPGLVNAHCHLEMSGLAGKTTLGKGFAAWAKSLGPHLGAPPAPEAMGKAAASMRQAGVAVVVDVSSRDPLLSAAALREAGLHGIVTMESIGRTFREPSTAGMTAAGHALYSTTPHVLQQAKEWCRNNHTVFGLHLAEHEEEEAFLLHGKGPLADMMPGKLLPKNFSIPKKSPAAYADSLKLLDRKTQAVHGVLLKDADIELLARRGTAVCLCPRSNENIGTGRAPWEALLEGGVTLCLGTDGLASTVDLDPWKDIAFVLKQKNGGLFLPSVLSWATSNPARILGLEGNYGSLAAGARACLSLLPETLKPYL